MKKALLISGLCFSLSAYAQTTFTGGALETAGNWDNGAPGPGNDGTVSVNGTLTGNQNNDWLNGGSVTINGGAVITAANGGFGDFNAFGGTVTVDNATINADDDVFTGTNGSLIFNTGSSVNATDDFAAQGFGTGASITITGGTHSAVDRFGIFDDNDNTISFTGGQMTAGSYAISTGTATIGGGATLLGGSGGLSFTGGSIVINNGWTGSWTVGSFSGTDWRDELIGGGWTYDGSLVDGAVFDANFQITGGDTLTVIPEPSTIALVFISIGALLVVRRRI